MQTDRNHYHGCVGKASDLAPFCTSARIQERPVCSCCSCPDPKTIATTTNTK